jgi:hypothetical protein
MWVSALLSSVSEIAKWGVGQGTRKLLAGGVQGGRTHQLRIFAPIDTAYQEALDTSNRAGTRIHGQGGLTNPLNCAP